MDDKSLYYIFYFGDDWKSKDYFFEMVLLEMKYSSPVIPYFLSILPWHNWFINVKSTNLKFIINYSCHAYPLGSHFKIHCRCWRNECVYFVALCANLFCLRQLYLFVNDYLDVGSSLRTTVHSNSIRLVVVIGCSRGSVDQMSTLTKPGSSSISSCKTDVIWTSL